MHTILVPVDGSDHALKALNIACDMAERYDGRLALFHVLLKSRTPDEILKLIVAKKFGAQFEIALRGSADQVTGLVSPKMLKLIGEQILEEAGERVRRRGVRAEILAIDEGEPAACILNALARTEANTIVMGSRGVGESQGSSFGSVSNAVFSQADCTCISVK